MPTFHQWVSSCKDVSGESVGMHKSDSSLLPEALITVVLDEEVKDGT